MKRARSKLRRGQFDPARPPGARTLKLTPAWRRYYWRWERHSWRQQLQQ